MRLSFCLPYIEYPSMEPTFNEDIIKNLTITIVENKPEAPWIKWNPEGVVFTENMLVDEERSISNYKDLIDNKKIKGCIIKFWLKNSKLF